MSWLRHNIRLQIGLALLLPFAVAALIPGVIAPYSPTDLRRRAVRGPVERLLARARTSSGETSSRASSTQHAPT